ncbi:MAG: hypothetical protein AB2598_16125 [Candidatus Thiodiazotropha sp.]
MTVTLFFEDFDGNGIGFASGYRFDTNPFGVWDVGGNAPPGFGQWMRFSGDDPAEPNLTPGTGGYAAIRIADTPDFGDNTYWMVSPLIDTRNHTDLALALDLHYRASGSPQEATLRILMRRVGESPVTLADINQATTGSHETSEHMSWDIAPGADFLQFAFMYSNTSMNPTPASIQLDNIRLTGTTACS